jgi:hypothetical protein
MKMPIVLSVVMAVLLFAGGPFAPCNAQDAAKDDTPTFYHLVPGTYVQGRPRFTVHYPKDWVEQRSPLGETFRVAPSGAPKFMGFRSPAFFIAITTFRFFDPPLDVPLDKYAEWVVSLFKRMVKDVKLTYNKPSRLRDGTPAYEYEMALLFNDRWSNSTTLVTQRGNFTVAVGVEYGSGKITEDLKAMLYSLEFEGPVSPEAVEVPPDVREFLAKWAAAALSHDLPQVMTHYSERYLHSGDTKGEMEREWRWDINDVAPSEVRTRVFDFVPVGDRAYLTVGIHFQGLKALKDSGCGV